MKTFNEFVNEINEAKDQVLAKIVQTEDKLFYLLTADKNEIMSFGYDFSKIKDEAAQFNMKLEPGSKNIKNIEKVKKSDLKDKTKYPSFTQRK